MLILSHVFFYKDPNDSNVKKRSNFSELKLTRWTLANKQNELSQTIMVDSNRIESDRY